MGSSFIFVGAVALGTGLVGLICGFIWGRSNVRSQIEDALDKARISADAREFSVREELDEKMVELAQFRSQAEEVPRLRQQLEKLESERPRISSGFRVNALAPETAAPPEQTVPEKAPPPPVEDSADKAIQKLLKSIEEKMNRVEDNPQTTADQSTTPAAKRFAVEIPPAVAQFPPKPVPAPAVAQQSLRPVPAPAPPSPRPAQSSAATRPSPTPVPKAQQPAPTAPSAAAEKDEWQEFARSLADLRRRNH